MTDLDYTLDNIRKNVDSNIKRNKNNVNNNIEQQSVFNVQLLDWADANTYPIINSSNNKNNSCNSNNEMIRREWDVIIGADVVWYSNNK